MKPLFAIVLTLTLLLGCATTPKNQNLPVQFGDSRTEVRALFGSPNRTGSEFDSFYDHGLVIGYDENGRVSSIVASRLHSGITYQGSILGVSVGDPASKAVELWGNSLSWERTPFEYSKAYFRYLGYSMELEVWSEYGEDSSFGRYESGNIKRIKVTR